MDEDVTVAISLLCTADSTECELQALEALFDAVHRHPGSANDEEVYFYQAEDLVFPKTVTLNDFVCYLFTRRFGWSEVICQREILEVRRLHGVGRSSAVEASLKAQLNCVLDGLINWLMNQKIGLLLVQSLTYTVLRANNQPVIRKQTFIHIFDWFSCHPTFSNEELYCHAKALLMSGITDVWSATRHVCVFKLSSLLHQFKLPLLEDFCHALFDVCSAECSSWQAQEGATMAVNTIVRKFKSTKPGTGDLSAATISRTDAVMQIIPDFISRRLQDVIYHLFADPQLSIRENAIKTFSSYLSIRQYPEAYFLELLSRLSIGGSLEQGRVHQLPMSGTEPVVKWMDAYLAESLLGMSVVYVKNIPIEHLQSNWALCLRVFTFYLMHPASTVRQTASSVVKFLVAKDTSSPNLCKSVLTSLGAMWKVNMETLSRSCLPDNCMDLPPEMLTYNQSNTAVNPSISSLNLPSEDVADKWEWREGRLLAYELLCQFLIKNYWLYIYGSTKLPQSSSTMNGPEHIVNSTRRAHRRASAHSILPVSSHEEQFFHQGLSNGDMGETSPDRAKDRTIRPRRATLGHMDEGYFKSLIKSRSAVRSLGKSSNMAALPILMAIKLLESASPSEACGNPDFPQARADQEPKMSDLLLAVLHQTLDCINSERWELRRMAEQVLPCVVEVMRWFDMEVLVEFWEKYLTSDTTVLSYGASSSFLLSLMHALKLAALINNSPRSCQDVYRSKEDIMVIIDCMRKQTQKFIPIFLMTLKRPLFDKLTVISIQILLSACEFDWLLPSQDKFTPEVISAIHSIDLITSICICESKSVRRRLLLIPTGGFLSFNPVENDEMARSVDHAVKYLIDSTCSLVHSVVKHGEIATTAAFLPSLTSLMGYTSSDHFINVYAACIAHLIQCIAESESETDPSLTNIKQEFFQRLLPCLFKLVSYHLTQSALECMTSFLLLNGSAQYITSLLSLLCSQCLSGLSAIKKGGSVTANKEPKVPQIPADLHLFSNDISVEEDQLNSDEDDPQDEVGVSARKNSVSLRSVDGEASSCGSDTDSNWDSWDEDEPKYSDTTTVYKNFIENLFKRLQLLGREKDFSASVAELPQQQQHMIGQLVKGVTAD